jgi:hypothetical protein
MAMPPHLSNATRLYSQSEYERRWQIKLLVETLFLQGFPTGSFARRLPQFRLGPDPVGDIYRHRAVRQLDTQADAP